MCTIHRMLITYLTLCAGLRVAQVRVIFRLPAAVCVAAGLHTSCAGEPLSYIEWFTQFRVYDDILQMYSSSVAPSTRHHIRRTRTSPHQTSSSIASTRITSRTTIITSLDITLQSYAESLW